MADINKPADSSQFAVETSTQKCSVCRDIKSMLTEPESFFDLGELQDLLDDPSSTCHKALLEFMVQSRFPSTYRSGVPENLLLDDTYGMKGIGLGYAGDDTAFIHRALLVAAPGTINKAGFGRIRESEWVDIDMLKEWVSECLKEHTGRCDDPLKLGRTSPAWLIDTVDNCLVAGHGIEEYVTLSYRWGDIQQLQNRSDILNALQIPGVLAKPEFTGLFSPALKHSIGLVRLLEERYLWVDALCIVQDNGEQTASQLRLMGSIYASAKFTIVVAEDDISCGIPGLRGVSQPRELDQLRFPLDGDDHVIFRQNPPLEYTSGCPLYFTRAWTFQEYFFSKRRLIFGSNEFHWSCKCCTYHEDIFGHDEDTSSDSESHFISNVIAGLPDFLGFDKLIRGYNCRDLSFQEDALAGASGFLAVMSRTFQGGFHYGLADMCFESALMWFPFLGPGMKRRTHSGRDHTVLRGSRLPSWSWLGWQGWSTQIRYTNRDEFKFFDSHPITKSITHWYSHTSPTSTIKSAIESPFSDEYLELLCQKGWKKEKFDFSKHLPPEDPSVKRFYVLGEDVYTHPDIPDKKFWRPLPIHFGTDMEVCMPPQHPYISCKTKRGWFGVKQIQTVYCTPGFYAQLSILDRNQRTCGAIKLPSIEQKEDFPPEDSHDNHTVELVAICLQQKPVIVNYPTEIRTIEKSEFREEYGILWIEWIDGVAYRKAAGFVDKESWEAHELEDVDLVLG